MKKELARVREQGYALDDEEDEIGLRCIGAPIFDASGRVVAAISLAATTEQIPTDRVRALAAVLRQTASEISTELKSLNHDGLVGSEHG